MFSLELYIRIWNMNSKRLAAPLYLWIHAMHNVFKKIVQSRNDVLISCQAVQKQTWQRTGNTEAKMPSIQNKAKNY